MSHILHLGHQPTDLSGIAGLISTAAGGFDPRNARKLVMP